MEKALEEYTESYVYFRRIRDHVSSLAPLEQIAVLQFFKGNYMQARELGVNILERAKSLESKEHFLIGALNLAQTQLFKGELGEALELLRLVRAKDPDQVFALRAKTLWGITQIHYLYQSAAESQLIETSQRYVAESATRDEVVCLEYLGLNEYYAGNYDKAKEYYDNILGRKEITASARAQTLRMLTDVYVAKAQWPEANETAALAEAAITKINERIELGALDRARGLIAANTRDHDTARDYFDKSIRLLREIGARYELALSYLTCGRCNIYSRDERRYFLRQAHDLFREMEVPKRVAEVEEEIGRVGPRSPMRLGDRLRGDDKNSGGDIGRGRGGDKPGRPLTLKSPALSGNGQTVIAGSPCMRELMQTIRRLAQTDLTVLLVGETGTGKDLLAEYIHRHSGRPGEFVTVNSAAIPNEMVEAELFGYAKGAFTSANRDKPGLFELADGGTFYLNEISCCTPEFQAKLLEVLETGMIRRLGETAKRRVDFRLIGASNQDLNRMIREERFRPDLFYRLREYQVALPPLQERREDFPALVHHFLLEAGCPQDGAALLARCEQIAAQFVGRPWPGNVRMLRAELRRLWFACDGDLTRLQRLAASRDEQSQREELIYAMRECGGNQSEAARRLGVSEGTVRNRIKRFRIVRQA
ncbi:MAG: sigma 54-interacting transcriptional regulator [bacterium]